MSSDQDQKVKIRTVLDVRPDRWDAALEKLNKEHPMTPIDYVESVDEIVSQTKHVKHFYLETINTPNFTQRNLMLFNKDLEVLKVLKDVELIDGSMYIKKPHAPKKSWFAWSMSFFYPRHTNVNVNLKRK
jgi:hypothetical protein